MWGDLPCQEEARAPALLTDLSGYDVVFGKLAATSLRSFCGLLAILPVLAIPLLLGSVTGKEVIDGFSRIKFGHGWEDTKCITRKENYIFQTLFSHMYKNKNDIDILI